LKRLKVEEQRNEEIISYELPRASARGKIRCTHALRGFSQTFISLGGSSSCHRKEQSGRTPDRRENSHLILRASTVRLSGEWYVDDLFTENVIYRNARINHTLKGVVSIRTGNF